MKTTQFAAGDRVQYWNHVTRRKIGILEVVSVKNRFVYTTPCLPDGRNFSFHLDGRATWSSNLSISAIAQLRASTGGTAPKQEDKP